MAEIRNEAGVKRAVKRLLEAHGWFVWMPPANAYGKAGISDFHALKDGKFLAVETKFGGNKPTALQHQFLSNVSDHRGYVAVVYETTLTAFEQMLKSL